ncbi:MAG: 50S ribosomal protein L11 methyltransferase [Hyphomicrobiales bacterium]|nr:50S ribosomal protein L11 methyltransferase [Hyphomicrobiales bacterium]
MTSATGRQRGSALVGQFTTTEQAAHRAMERLAEHFAGDDVGIGLIDTGNGRWQVALYFSVPPERKAVAAAVAAAAGAKAAAALHFARIAAIDWARASLAGLAPVAAGRFVIHGAHDRARVPPNRIGIEIEAALAFGTGHHGTTRGCLLALDRLCKLLDKPKPANLDRHPEPRATRAFTRAVATEFTQAVPATGAHLRMTKMRILDLGTGSGVLAIAAARALHARVLATDIDREAVRVARGNVRHNRAGAMVEVARAAGVTAARLRAGARFDLIFANILLGPLLCLATPLRRLAAPGARVVLSGLLAAQANAIIAAYRPLVLERRITLDGWSTLVFRRHTRHATADD